MAGRRRRAAERVGAFAASLRNPRLRRVQLAWAGCTTADLAQEVALGVYAFAALGVGGVGLMGLVRSLPAAVLGPLAAAAADRHRRERVLLAVLLARTALLAAIAASLAAGGPVAAVYVLAAADGIVYTLYWPAQSALLPDVATTAQELTASNVAATTVENLGGLVGPGLAGVLLAVAAPWAVFAASALLTAMAAVAMARIPPVAAAVDGGVRPGAGSALLAGFGALLGDRGPRLVLLVYLAHTLCLGALSVLVVVVALSVLELGRGGVGFLATVLGFGGLAGSLAAVGLVGRSRLGGPFSLGLALSGLALAALAVVPRTGVAVAALALVGACTAVVDVCALNLLQRIVAPGVLGRALGLVEGGWWAVFGLGSLAAGLVVDGAGVGAGLAATGGFLMAVAAATSWALASVDARARPPERQLAALRAVPMFAGQPPLALERLALRLVPVSAAAGEAVVASGDPGDRFYIVEDGSLRVTTDTDVAELGPGDWFGEVALLDDVPRTATVRAVTPARLLALDRDEFLAAVTTRSRGSRGGQRPAPPAVQG